MPEVVTNGVRLNAVDLGQGPPLVMLHGLLLGNLATWYLTAAPVLARNYGVRLYDLRGHGRSERCRTGYDLATQVRDLEGLVDGRDELTLVGHSYGALVALRFALDHPARVRQLVLVEPPLPISDHQELMEFLARTPEQMLEVLPEQTRAAVSNGGRQGRRWLESLGFLTMETTLIDDIRSEADIEEDVLAALSVETDLITGRQSSCVPSVERLAGLIPGARLHRLDGGHFLPLESPKALTALLVVVTRG